MVYIKNIIMIQTLILGCSAQVLPMGMQTLPALSTTETRALHLPPQLHSMPDGINSYMGALPKIERKAVTLEQKIDAILAFLLLFQKSCPQLPWQ
jgi:hypothetical protein